MFTTQKGQCYTTKVRKEKQNYERRFLWVQLRNNFMKDKTFGIIIRKITSTPSYFKSFLCLSFLPMFLFEYIFSISLYLSHPVQKRSTRQHFLPSFPYITLSVSLPLPPTSSLSPSPSVSLSPSPSHTLRLSLSLYIKTLF